MLGWPNKTSEKIIICAGFVRPAQQIFIPTKSHKIQLLGWPNKIQEIFFLIYTIFIQALYLKATFLQISNNLDSNLR